MRTFKRFGVVFFSFLLGGALVVGCGSVKDGAIVPTGEQTTQQFRRAQQGTQQGTQPSGVLSQDVQNALKETLIDEYKARALYEKVIRTFGSVRPFSAIVGAEVRHAQALLNLFQKYGLKAPANPWTPAKLPTYSSVEEACQGGVKAEIDNAAIYDRLLKLDLPQDVRSVFMNLRDASTDNHMAAFQRCS